NAPRCCTSRGDLARNVAPPKLREERASAGPFCIGKLDAVLAGFLPSEVQSRFLCRTNLASPSRRASRSTSLAAWIPRPTRSARQVLHSLRLPASQLAFHDILKLFLT